MKKLSIKQKAQSFVSILFSCCKKKLRISKKHKIRKNLVSQNFRTKSPFYLYTVADASKLSVEVETVVNFLERCDMGGTLFWSLT